MCLRLIFFVFHISPLFQNTDTKTPETTRSKASLREVPELAGARPLALPGGEGILELDARRGRGVGEDSGEAGRGGGGARAGRAARHRAKRGRFGGPEAALDQPRRRGGVGDRRRLRRREAVDRGGAVFGEREAQGRLQVEALHRRASGED